MFAARILVTLMMVRFLRFWRNAWVLLVCSCGLVLDSGPPRPESSSDAGTVVDAATEDAAVRDGGAPDAQRDAAVVDGGVDASNTDAAVDAGFDAGTEAGVTDAATRDGGDDASTIADAGFGLDAALCPPGQRECSGTCVDFDRSRDHCGGCGFVCEPDALCINGSCQPGWVDVAAGQDHTCAVTSAGSVYCWGTSIATGVATSTFPTPVGESGVSDPFVLRLDLDEENGVDDVLAVGDQYSCAIDPGARSGANRVSCWGEWAPGASSATASRMPESHTFGQIVGGNTFACGAEDVGLLSCWGSNDHVQLGDLFPTPEVPNLVWMASSFDALALGDQHGCFGDGVNGVLCWGQGAQRQLGVASMFDLGSPMPAVPIRMQQTSGGIEHHCGITQNKNVFCWGGIGTLDVDTGQDLSRLLYGRELTDPPESPVEVLSTNRAVDLAVGDYHSCVALEPNGAGGELRCWGQVPLAGRWVNPPERVVLGFDGFDDRVNNASVVDLEAGNAHTCAIFEDHRLYCWGSNDSLALGCASPAANAVCEVPLP